METRARYVLIGLFTLAVIAAGFGFVYWLHHGAGWSERTAYRIRFENSVSGLRAGSAVQFNGIRVGEVTELTLNPADPRQVSVVIVVERDTPIRADTQIAIDSQGLMGAPTIALRGGTANSQALVGSDGGLPLIVADPAAGQDTMQAARQVLRRIDNVLADNSEPLRSTIANLDKFSGALARNSDKLDAIVDGLTQMTGAGAAKAPLPVYDLTAVRTLPTIDKTPRSQLTVAEPTALIAFDTQRILVQASGEGARPLDKAQWSDTLPKLVQAKIIESFENANLRAVVARPTEGLNLDYQLLIEIRNFKITMTPAARAEVELAVRLLDKDRIVDARTFTATMPSEGIEPAAVVAAFDEAFGKVAAELVMWAAKKI